jgi:hypothetical protein
MGKDTETPDSYDTTATADKQTATNKKAWEEGITANRSNQVGTEGTLDWAKDPATGQWTQTTAYNKPNQDYYDTLTGNVQDFASGMDTSQVDLGGAPGMPSAVTAPNQQILDTVNALNSRRDTEEMNADRARRSAMGLSEASGSAWDRGEQNLGAIRTDRARKGLLDAYTQSNTAFGQGMDLHRTGVSDILNERASNLGMFSGLNAAKQGMRGPTFQSTGGSVGTYNPADYMGAARDQYGMELNESNAGNMDKSNMMSSIGTAASVAATVW